MQPIDSVRRCQPVEFSARVVDVNNYNILYDERVGYPPDDIYYPVFQPCFNNELKQLKECDQSKINHPTLVIKLESITFPEHETSCFRGWPGWDFFVSQEFNIQIGDSIKISEYIAEESLLHKVQYQGRVENITRPEANSVFIYQQMNSFYNYSVQTNIFAFKSKNPMSLKSRKTNETYY